MLLAPYLPLIFIFHREYCPVARYSVRCPAAVLLNGIPPKPVDTTEPVFTDRNIFWKSMKPPGVKSIPPMRKDNGDSLGFSVSWSTFVLAGAATVLVNAALARCGVVSAFFLSASSCC